MKQMNGFIKGLLSAILVSPLGLYAIAQSKRPSAPVNLITLFEGITYRSERRMLPRPNVIHLFQVDLTTPGLRAFVTPGQRASDDTETTAQTTSSFLQKHKLQFAINAGYFYDFEEQTPWNYFPREGDRVNVLGQSISNGQEYSPSQPYWSTLCFDGKQQAQILEKLPCPPGTQNAVAGNIIFRPQRRRKLFRDSKPYSRTVVGLDKARKTLWIVIIDGKQPNHSEGLTLSETEAIVRKLGIEIALNLDGGGSVTAVRAGKTGPVVLNAPIHGKWPMNERAIATHLGFYAEPVSKSEKAL